MSFPRTASEIPATAMIIASNGLARKRVIGDRRSIFRDAYGTVIGTIDRFHGFTHSFSLIDYKSADVSVLVRNRKTREQTDHKLFLSRADAFAWIETQLADF